MLDFDAGKYAAYVWPSFAITAAIFAGMIWDSLARARRWRAKAESYGPAARSPAEDGGTAQDPGA